MTLTRRLSRPCGARMAIITAVAATTTAFAIHGFMISGPMCPPYLWLLDFQPLQELLVLVADEFDHLRAVGDNPLVDSDGEGPRIGLRIVDRKLDVQLPEVHAPEPLGHLRSLGQRTASGIEPSIAAVVVRLAHKRVALPSSDGVA